MRTNPRATRTGNTTPGEENDQETRPTPSDLVDPDGAQVEAAISGDPLAFEELVLRYQNRIYTRISIMVKDREVAADLTQETFIKAFTGLDSFRGESRFSTWLGRIAINTTLHHFEKSKAQKRRARVVSLNSRAGWNQDGALEIADPSQLPDEWAERNERQRAILQAVAELDDEYRTALALRELYELSYREIEEVLCVPIGTVKSKIFRARQILQDKLKHIR